MKNRYYRRIIFDIQSTEKSECEKKELKEIKMNKLKFKSNIAL